MEREGILERRLKERVMVFDFEDFRGVAQGLVSPIGEVWEEARALFVVIVFCNASALLACKEQTMRSAVSLGLYECIDAVLLGEIPVCDHGDAEDSAGCTSLTFRKPLGEQVFGDGGGKRRRGEKGREEILEEVAELLGVSVEALLPAVDGEGRLMLSRIEKSWELEEGDLRGVFSKNISERRFAEGLLQLVGRTIGKELEVVREEELLGMVAQYNGMLAIGMRLLGKGKKADRYFLRARTALGYVMDDCCVVTALALHLVAYYSAGTLIPRGTIHVSGMNRAKTLWALGCHVVSECGEALAPDIVLGIMRNHGKEGFRALTAREKVAEIVVRIQTNLPNKPLHKSLLTELDMALALTSTYTLGGRLVQAHCGGLLLLRAILLHSTDEKLQCLEAVDQALENFKDPMWIFADHSIFSIFLQVLPIVIDADPNPIARVTTILNILHVASTLWPAMLPLVQHATARAIAQPSLRFLAECIFPLQPDRIQPPEETFLPEGVDKRLDEIAEKMGLETSSDTSTVSSLLRPQILWPGKEDQMPVLTTESDLATAARTQQDPDSDHDVEANPISIGNFDTFFDDVVRKI